MSDLDTMERRIKEIFDRAGKDIKANWDKWLAGINDDLKNLQADYEAAKASGDGKRIRETGMALSRAKRTKIMGNAYYQKMVDQAVQRLNDANAQAMAYINGKMPKVYASSFNDSDRQIADGVPGNIGISFDLVDESTVARLMKDPTLDLADLQHGINPQKMAAWNSKAISSEILQGIVAGESIPNIAARLMNVAGMDERAAKRNARTMTTGAENAGREDSYKRAQDMGIALHQQWIATLDGRTRHSHRSLDGEVQEVGKPFSNGCRFPGDPEGPAWEIYNCRCTLIAKLDGFDRDKIDRWNKLEDQSYEEWKTGGKGRKVPTYTEEEKTALHEYTTSAYSAINSLLRGEESYGTEYVKNIIAEIDKAMEITPDYEGDTLFRGTDMAEIRGLFPVSRKRSWYEDPDNLKSLIGKKTVIPSYISTSVEDVFDAYKKGVRVEYELGEGVSAIDMTPFTNQKQEAEYLIDRDLDAEIIDVLFETDKDGDVSGEILFKIKLTKRR